jgi:hypothetical protein
MVRSRVSIRLRIAMDACRPHELIVDALALVAPRSRIGVTSSRITLRPTPYILGCGFINSKPAARGNTHCA